MKKKVNWSILLAVVALVVLLAVGTVGAQEGIPGEIEPELEPGGEIEPEPEAGEAAEEEEAGPEGTAVRIDFELAPGHSAKRGHYSVQLPGGAEVASWYALDGWLDSGWINNLEIKGDAVQVQVLYYPGPETEPTVMRILNPAPGTDMGWIGEGMAHALEVAWPDMPVEGIDDSDL
ncbi:MAG: hypothetical protein JSV68_25090 [Anaerolineaceae bacterium]|nr:MAG: hypothetical protein JSV68_25090 [Anaerolineaceae bacterium]